MSELSKVRMVGPLASYAEGFWDELVRLGYTPRTARDHAYVLAHLSRWLDQEGLEPADLTPQMVERFVLARRHAGYRRGLTARSLRALLGYLREVGAVPPVTQPVSDSAIEVLLVSYRRYLFDERRLTPATVRLDEDIARRFLTECALGADLDVNRLTPAGVTEFVVTESRQYSTGSMKVLTVALRSLLRFLCVAGVVERDLSVVVPAVASRPMTTLPKGVEASVVAALLGSCDRTRSVGLRDYAVLTLLVRLGLRAGEVAALTLDEVDWRSGELVVRGKGGRVDRLPLPRDVGEALVDYLRNGRPRSSSRALFVRVCAPDGAMSAGSVAMVPRSASRRAGVPIVGAHRLRHTAAIEILAGGGSLAEVAQILRHHCEATTALYAKVDRAALELVVRPWPGEQR